MRLRLELSRCAAWFDRRLDSQSTEWSSGSFLPFVASRRKQDRRLESAQQAFAEAIADIASTEARHAAESIWRAQSLQDLWHVRAELFDVIARAHDQQQALIRLARLAAHFPTRSPRSGLVPLDSRNGPGSLTTTR